MKRGILCFVVAIAMLVPLLAGACPAPAEKAPIKIGFITDLTSFLSLNGIPGKQAVTLAMEEIGYEIAGREVELIIEDEGSDPTVAMDKARKLVETDKVCMLLGPFFGGSVVAVANYANEVKIPNICIWYSIADDAQLEAKWTWAPWGTTSQLSYPSGIYAYDLGYRTATLMGTDYVSGHEFLGSFVAGFTERGGEIIQEQWIPMNTNDIAPYISALEEADVFVPWLAGVTATVGIKQIKEYGVDMPIIMPQAGHMAHPQQIAEIGDDGLGIITCEAYVWTIDNQKNQAFVKAYQDRWGELPSGAAYGAYAPLKIALAALSKTGGDTSPEALAKALDETSYEGILGTFQFADERVGIGNYVIHQAIKIGDEYSTEVLASYQVRTDRVGDKLVHSIVK
jgi:branched-chain amino acid transport system substrate-binding protein